MTNYGTILNACLPVFLVVGAGYALRRWRVLTAEADASLMRVVLNLLFPAFIIDHLLGNPALGDPGGVAIAASAGALFVLLGIAIAYWVATAIGAEADHRGTFALAAGLQNYGFIPIPILKALFDHETVGVHLMHTLGVEIALWTAGIVVLTSGRQGGWRNLVNAPLITTIACIAANSAGLGDSMPPIGGSAIGMLSACAVPLSLLLIGATIRDLLRAAPAGGRAARPLAEAGAAITVRLLALPALMLLFARYMPLSLELKRVLVVQAAMPAAVFPIILARRYGGDAGTAVRVVVATTVLAVFTIPPAIVFGLWCTGASP